MKRFLKIFPATAVSLFMVVIPFVVLAGLTVVNDPKITFKNPLQSVDLPVLIRTVKDQLMPLAVTIVSLYIIFAGFQYVWAAATGNGTITQKAKDHIRSALFFALLIAAGSAILNAIMQFAREIGSP